MSVDYSNDLLLIICASGKQVARLLPFLVNKWKRLRLVVNSKPSQDRLQKEYPRAEVVQANLTEPQECRQLLRGVTSVYHIGPTFHPHETEIGYNMIDAAVAEGNSFQHFVFSSVLNTQIRKMFNHDCKRYIEEYLLESGLNYTIINPSNFLDSFPLEKALENGVCPHPYNINTKSSQTSLYDLGEAAAKILEERDKHYLAQYQMISVGPSSRREQCEEASQILGKELKAEALPLQVSLGDEANKTLGIGSHPYTIDGARRLNLYYNHRGLLGNPNTMRWLLGREPMSFEEWLKGKMASLKGEKYDFIDARKTKVK